MISSGKNCHCSQPRLCSSQRSAPHVKVPGYTFTLHGQRKFFLEAKKPSVYIKGDVAPAYQLRRYAWSAKLPLSIISEFEESPDLLPKNELLAPSRRAIP